MMLDLSASQAAGRIVTANRGVGSARAESHLYLAWWEAFPLHSGKRIPVRSATILPYIPLAEWPRW